MSEIKYWRDETGQLWWCNSHQREATYIRNQIGGADKHCCDPNLRGILLPCRCVDLTDQVEIIAA